MPFKRIINILFSSRLLLFFKLLVLSLFWVVANFLKAVPNNGKIIFCTLDDDVLFREDDGQGRYAYLPLNLLSQIGYTIYFYKRQGPVEYKRLGRYGRFIYSIKNLKFTNHVPVDTSNIIYVFDLPRPELLRRKWKKLVYVNILKPTHFQYGQTLTLPFFMHPLMCREKQVDTIFSLRALPKRMRIFFGGNTSKDSYQGQSVTRYGQLRRYEAVEYVLSQIKETQVVPNLDDFRKFLKESSYSNTFLMLKADEAGQGETAEWLGTLAQSHFFMCFSGTNLPICHNAVESMSVGTIPIISYQDWFFPPLEPMKNAIVYSGKEDLIVKIQEALRMPEQHIVEMSRNVCAYYDQYLTPAHFGKKFEANTDQICTLMLYPRLICTPQEEARLKHIKDDLNKFLSDAGVL